MGARNHKGQRKLKVYYIRISKKEILRLAILLLFVGKNKFLTTLSVLGLLIVDLFWFFDVVGDFAQKEIADGDWF